MKRLLLYVHYNKFGQLSEHVVYQLTQLRPLFSKIVFISNSQLKVSDHERLVSEQLIDSLMQRENEGFDFAAWRDAMLAQGFDALTAYDSLTLMNDTCFGPLWDLTPTFEAFEANEQVSFLGMTNHRATKRVKEHVQSYFFEFQKSCL